MEVIKIKELIERIKKNPEVQDNLKRTLEKIKENLEKSRK